MKGVCNACVWVEESPKLIGQKEIELRLLDRFREKTKNVFIGSVSGGKDGSYIAYNLKHKYGMNPLW